jgi:glucose-1-phosphate cytidylyltransferase
MKVVLFCGGLGLRMRSGADSAPKPMMTIGDRPVLWHVMRYYAHFGHRDFILCLGYGAAAVKDYFLNYEETRTNDFVLDRGGREVRLLSSDIEDWRITFVDTGLDTGIGERLRRVRPYLDDDELFLANYGDVLTDAPLDRIVEEMAAGDAIASLLAVPPQGSFHTVSFGADSRIEEIRSVTELPLWVNGGYFVLRREVFDVLGPGEGTSSATPSPVWPPAASCSPSPTTVSGHRWTRSRNAATSRRCTAAGLDRGRSGRTGRGRRSWTPRSATTGCTSRTRDW